MVESRTPLIHHGRVKDSINFEKTSDKNLKEFLFGNSQIGSANQRTPSFIYEVGNSSSNRILFILPNKNSVLRRGERDL